MFARMRNSKLTARINKNIALKLALIICSVAGVFMMTGLLYFRNDVLITDGAQTKTVYTASADPKEILRENNIDVTPYDKLIFSGFKEDGTTATLEIKRAFATDVIIDGEKKATVYSVDDTVAAVLEKFDITVGQYDKVTPAPDSVLTNHATIEIDRAFDVNITADGKTVAVGCFEDTVATLLDRAGITIDDDDMVSEPLDAVIAEPTDIKVSRVKIVTEFTDRVIPFNVKTVTSNLVVIGNREVQVEGVNGEIRTTTVTTYIDGVKTGVTRNTEVITEKVDAVVVEGAAVAEPYCKIDDPSIILKDGRPVNYEYIISGKATAYTAPMGSLTASGRPAEIGTCAVNPNVIPYGSKVYIVGQNNDIVYGYAIAADTGDGMMDGSIPVDVYMGNSEDHYYDSCDWGLQYVDIYVVEVGNG